MIRLMWHDSCWWVYWFTLPVALKTCVLICLVTKKVRWDEDMKWIVNLKWDNRFYIHQWYICNDSKIYLIQLITINKVQSIIVYDIIIYYAVDLYTYYIYLLYR